jgi:VanZ like family/Concanavalin A-like lectin/glucanases superfamily
MRVLFWDAICLAVVCVVLTLGLWPFHSPENDVSWLRDRSGLRFGKSSTVFSSHAFETKTVENESSGSVEIWLQPRRIWDSGTFLAFYTTGNPHQFSLRQFNGGLELQAGIRNDPDAAKTAIVYLKNTFVRSGPVFLGITSGINGMSVYVDGVPAKAEPHVQLSAKDLTGRLVLGDSPGQGDSWSGHLLGVAIYGRELTPTQVLRHYQTWGDRGRPEICGGERNLALYLFGERAGRIIHDSAGSGVNLYLPEKYTVLDQIFLEPFWKEFSMSRSYWAAVVKNVVGFIPFGFCFYACLCGHRVKSAAIATVILGTATSLTIEVLQAYLPTRDSGMTDIFTNTLGTWIGIVTCRTVISVLAARFPRLPFAAFPK